MPQADINYLAVLVATLANMVIGALWYSPSAFGKSWMALVGKTPEDAKRGAPKAYTGAAIAALIASFVLAHFVDYTGSTTFYTGTQTGFGAWLGFVFPVLLADMLFNTKPMKLLVLTSLEHMFALMTMGGILAVWV